MFLNDYRMGENSAALTNLRWKEMSHEMRVWTLLLTINVLSAPAYQMCKTEIDTQWWNMINWWFPKLMKAIDIQYRRLKSCVSLAMVKIENHGFLCWYRIVPKISLKNINGRKLNMQSLSVRLVSLVVCLSVSPTPLSLSLSVHTEPSCDVFPHLHCVPSACDQYINKYIGTE